LFDAHDLVLLRQASRPTGRRGMLTTYVTITI
jgi:hypothetical protein